VYTNILVAYDGSEGARAALGRAVELATASGGALTLVEAVGEALPPLVPGAPRTASSEQGVKARAELREAVEALDPELQASPWAVGGPPGKAILTVAEDIEADLIVTGSRGRGLVTSAVLGSVSGEIVRGAACDVLVVHPAA